MAALTWFILGACAMLAGIIFGGIIVIVTGLVDSPLSDHHYVD